MCLFTVTQELYEKSLVRVADGSLSADLLEIKTFLTVPQVNTVIHVTLTVWSFTDVHFMSCLVVDFTVCFQNLVKVMTICPRHDLVSLTLREMHEM